MERSESTLHTRRRISWNESEVARASCTGVHVPTGAYLSLWCARDILISSQSFSLSLSLSLSLSFSSVYVHLLPSLLTVLFLIYRPFPLYLFSSTSLPLFFHLCSPLLMIISLLSFRSVYTRSCFFLSCCGYTLLLLLFPNAELDGFFGSVHREVPDRER